MLKQYAFSLFILLAIGCTGHADKAYTGKKAVTVPAARFYSTSVKDTFSIFTSLPDDYTENNAGKYPVIYILDANLYFDIFSVIIKKYSEVGLLPPAILVGIGYKDFPAMDSLRNRDYTYPAAIPEYEMTTSGQADKFLEFIHNELVPDINARYHVGKNSRILMGHSLGGYFALYAFRQQLLSAHNRFDGYIAASPSLHYNHYYMLGELEKSGNSDTSKVKVYTTFGGVEDAESAKDSTMLTTARSLEALFKPFREKRNIECKGEVYSNLDHMDTQIPTFVKGLQWILQ